MTDKTSDITQNSDYDLVFEKLFMPDIYSIESNYTLDKAFAISNEQLDQVFKSLKLKGKKVLTVGSSGDQALNAILKGSKDITIIDSNIFARPYIEYKLAVIKTFDYLTFSDIFIKSNFFSWKVYSKISHLLSKNVQSFWDSLMVDLSENNYGQEFCAKTIKGKMLFIDHRDQYSSFYNNKQVYNRLQRLLNNNDIAISYITAEFQEFPIVLKQQYDLIYLSNIFDYYNELHNNLFEKTINLLYQNNLNTNGIVVVNYSFNEELQNSPKQLAGHKINHIKISRFADGETNQDVVWLIKKPCLTMKTKIDDELTI